MSSRSLNKVELIGHLTQDPELKRSSKGVSVCTVIVATNRAWTTEAGEKKEDTQFHRVVAWFRLADLFAQLLTKSSRVYISGRMESHKFLKNGNEVTSTEIIAEDMIVLDKMKETVEQSCIPERPDPLLVSKYPEGGKL